MLSNIRNNLVFAIPLTTFDFWPTSLFEFLYSNDTPIFCMEWEMQFLHWCLVAKNAKNCIVPFFSKSLLCNHAVRLVVFMSAVGVFLGHGRSAAIFKYDSNFLSFYHGTFPGICAKCTLFF